MSERLKYAKLRLISPADRAAAPLDVKVDQKGSDNVDTGENIKSSCKKSKFFTTESSSQNTFIEIDDEQSDDHNKESNDPYSRRRSVSDHEVCSVDGPKMPKLRKKISKESGVISHFLNPHNPENDDFEEKRHRAVSQPKQKKVKRAVKKTNKPKNQSDIRNLFKKYKSDYDVLHKLIEDHSVSEQIDPEQLQMALAMSRSLVDLKCSSSASSSTEILTSSGSCSITAEERRIVGIRTTLEQFGFRCKNSFTDYDLNVIFGAGCKNVKKIKHTRATNLQRRTIKELADFIDKQTSTIFPVETITLGSRSNVLYPSVNLQSNLSNLFWMAQTEQTSKNLFFKYYVPELLEVNPAPAGCLLKDWSKIPGREKTPEPNSCAKITDLNSSFAQGCSLNRCARPTSPDLFDEFEDEFSNANFCRNGTGTINQFERIRKDKVSENEDALFAPSEEPNSEETVAENSSVPNTQIGESAAAIRKELQMKQESNRILCKGSDLVEKLNESEVEHCTNTRMKEATVLNRSSVGNEDDKSSELDSPSGEVSALHSSAENMFDETEIVPIVSFEVNSSEEEETHREQYFNADMSEQPFNGCISKAIAEPPKDTTTKTMK
uniref:Uncharacterized protein n=1 Tax=Anopheles atroparvus TaxID=41427 RepID=A0A182J724_ANOAO